MELLNLDSINSYPNWEWILRCYGYYERPTFYFCIPSHLPTAKCKPICACAVDMWSHRGGGGGFTVWIRVCVCACAHARLCVCLCVSQPPCAAILVRLWSRCSQVRSLPVSLVFEKQSNCTEVTATVCIYVLVPILVLKWLFLFCLIIVLFTLFGSAWLDAITAAVWCLLCCSQYEVLVLFLNFSPPV